MTEIGTRAKQKQDSREKGEMTEKGTRAEQEQDSREQGEMTSQTDTIGTEKQKWREEVFVNTKLVLQ